MSCHSTSGGIVSTSLARLVTGLPEKEIQHLFHLLRREAKGLPAPSELDVSAWRSRQYDLLSRMRQMSDNRRDKLHNRLFRSRSESVPDGPTFYAWRTIEARARQEKTIQEIPEAVDLDPPGSHAHLYELGEDGRPTRIWYASYGSNLHRDRFMHYIEGGQPVGSTRKYDGCTDQTEPQGDIPIRFAGARPHFALTSRVWRGGIAFIDQQKDPSSLGLGRAYDISIEQFDEVVCQENGGWTKWATKVPLDEALTEGRSVTGTGSYETILHIGDYNGAPVLTFTAPFTTNEALTRSGSITRTPIGDKTPIRMPVMTNKPSPAYLRMIGSGLNETFGMDEIQQADYLRGCPGGEKWSRQQMVRILRGQDPDPPKANIPTGETKETKPATKKTAPGKNKTAQPDQTTAQPTLPVFSNAPKTNNTTNVGATGNTAIPLGPAPDHIQKKQAQLLEEQKLATNEQKYLEDNIKFFQTKIKSSLTDTDRQQWQDILEQKTQQYNQLGENLKEIEDDLKALQKQQPTPPTTTTSPATKTTAPPRPTTQRPTTPPINPGPSGPKNKMPRVKTYASVEQQQVGVKRWKRLYTRSEETVVALQTQLQEIETKIQAHPDHPKNYKEKSRKEQALNNAIRTRETLKAKVQQAENQRPAHYYDPEKTRTLAEWQSEDGRLIAEHQTLETAHARKQKEITEKSRNRTYTNHEIETENNRLNRIRQRMHTIENRLTETASIIGNIMGRS